MDKVVSLRRERGRGGKGGAEGGGEGGGRGGQREGGKGGGQHLLEGIEVDSSSACSGARSDGEQQGCE